MDDDGTRANRIRRDGGDRGRGASQTPGAGDASGVDAELAIPALRFSDDGTDDAPYTEPTTTGTAITES